MRNIFDQYCRQENRLTHALASSLAEDPYLLRRFLKWAAGYVKPKSKLTILEQGVPWAPDVTEEEAHKKGLPDIWIYSDDNWALAIESKISARITAAQLKRHQQTAAERGWDKFNLLVLDAKAQSKELPQGVIFKRWPEFYAWISGQTRKPFWAKQLKKYMEVLEGQLIAEGYLKNGALTMFSGIPFDSSNPYNYVEAKRLLKLAMEEIRKRKLLETQLRINTRSAGRKAITGKEGNSVWNYLPIKHSNIIRAFTAWPHFTLGIESERTIAIMVIPNGIKSALRHNLTKLGSEGFIKIVRQVNTSLEEITRKDDGAAPFLIAVQRRYPSQRSRPIYDAKIEFDLRTAFPSKMNCNAVQKQPQWLDATFNSFLNKRSNLQLAIGMSFPYDRSKSIKSPGFIDMVAKTWIACKPLLKALRAIS